jgi:predicted HicB family RNase H-like nuclease
MNKEQAFEKFSDWYESCLEAGIEPEEVVAMMGEMALLTDPETVEKLQNEGVINNY